MACLGTSVESLQLLQEYTKLKRLIDSHKRKGTSCGLLPSIRHRTTVHSSRRRVQASTSRDPTPFSLVRSDVGIRRPVSRNTESKNRKAIAAKRTQNWKLGFSSSTSLDNKLLPKARLPLTSTARDNGSRNTKYKVTNYHVNPNVPPPVVDISSPAKQPAVGVSKYSWHRGQKVTTTTPSPISAKNKILGDPRKSRERYVLLNSKVLSPKLTTRKISKYKIRNVKSKTKRSPALKKLRQVKKYSVKYVPVKKSSKVATARVKQRPVVVNKRYVLRRQRGDGPKEKGKSGRTRFVMIGNLLYRSSKTKLARTGSVKMSRSRATVVSPKASGKTPQAELAPTMMKQSYNSCKDRIISVRGVRFAMDSQRKTLRRLTSSASTWQNGFNSQDGGSLISFGNNAVVARVDIGGETYIQTRPGVLIKSSTKQLRSLASRVVSRSIYHLTSSKRRKLQQFCLFYNKFGHCRKQEKGTCPYIHDADKIAICKRFLHGDCNVEDCKFSHQLCRSKMPVCTFFIRGRCSNDSCPYLHVNVNPEAEVCPDFAKGYCPQGETCKKWHVNLCSQFEQTGRCDRGNTCPLTHFQKDETTGRRNVAGRQRGRTDAAVATTTSAACPCDNQDWPSDDNPKDGPQKKRRLPSFISLCGFDDAESGGHVAEREDVPATAAEEIRLQIKPGFVKG